MKGYTKTGIISSHLFYNGDANYYLGEQNAPILHVMKMATGNKATCILYII